MKPILGEYLLEAMDPKEGLIARHDTHQVAHDLLQLMMELRGSPVTTLGRELISFPAHIWNPKCQRPTSSKAAKKKPGQFAIAILAAGKGTRLKSHRPKVLHEIGGKPLLAHVVAAASRGRAAAEHFRHHRI